LHFLGGRGVCVKAIPRTACCWQKHHFDYLTNESKSGVNSTNFFPLKKHIFFRFHC